MFWAEGNTAPEEEENDMNTYTIRKKITGAVHITSLTMNMCPAVTRGNVTGWYMKEYMDSAGAALNAAEVWGTVCKTCRKNAEEIINGTPATRQPAALSGEMPSLEEIADEAPFTPAERKLAEALTATGHNALSAPTAATDSAIRTREEWLIQAVAMLSKIFEAQGFKVPPVRISVGWPGAKSRKGLRQTIGQCWNSASAKDGVQQIFVSPLLDNPTDILAVIMHELVHAVDGCKNAHKAPFKRIAVLVGMVGKMTTSTAGPTLLAVFPKVLEALGKYDHAALDPGMTVGRVQTNKHLKITCGSCGFASRATQKQLDEHGISQHCGEDMEEA